MRPKVKKNLNKHCYDYKGRQAVHRAAALLCMSAVLSLAYAESAEVNAYAATAVYPDTGSEAAAVSSGVTASRNFTRTEEEWNTLSDNTLNWDEIAALVHEYNATVIKNRSELSKDERRSMDASEVSDYLSSRADEMEQKADEADQTSAVLSATYRNQANSLRRQADSNLDDFEAIRLSYEQIEKQTALSAKTQFLSYYSALYKNENSASNLAYLEKAYNSAVNRKNAGMGTELEALTAKESWDNARAEAVTLQNDISANRQSLIVLCGWKYDADAVIGSVPELSAEDIARVSYDEDMEKAKNANYTLKIDAIRLKNAKDQSYQTLVTEQETQTKNDTDSFGISFKALYDGLLSSVTAYNNSVAAKANGDKDLEYAKRQYELGMISKIELESAENKAGTLSTGVKTAYNDMLLARAKYDAAVNDGIL